MNMHVKCDEAIPMEILTQLTMGIRGLISECEDVQQLNAAVNSRMPTDPNFTIECTMSPENELVVNIARA